jgi:hypothetical protein
MATVYKLDLQLTSAYINYNDEDVKKLLKKQLKTIKKQLPMKK